MSEFQQIASSSIPDLLSTKLAFPRPRPALVPRTSLFALLDNSLEHPLTLLSAPAGFGKTTLARMWIHAHIPLTDNAIASSFTQMRREGISHTIEHEPFLAAWLSLDAGDNDPVRFWRYVIAACQRFDATMGHSVLERLSSLQPFSLEAQLQFSFEAILTMLINDLAKLQVPCVLVMEDYHVITLPQIHKMVAFLLDHLPANVHIMLLSRSDPPLPLARLRAHSDILELRTADLRFSLEETRMFLQKTLPFRLSEETISLLHERTEGWEAGLKLVSVALREYTGFEERERFLGTLTGSYRPFLEYLVSDVLNAQPEPVQEFLLQTSMLSRLTGSLCDAVTSRQNSTLLLEQIERANLFLEPLDGAGQWYRYHALFAEAMQHEARHRLGEERLHACFHRASTWYEQHNRLSDAVEAALLAEDFTRASVLIEQQSGTFFALGTNEIYTLRRWLGQFPQAVLRHLPSLCLTYVTALMFEPDGRVISDVARREQIEALLTMAEQQWHIEDKTGPIGEVYTFRALLTVWQGDFRKAGAFAKQALTFLQEEQIEWRSASLNIVGAEERLFGSLDKALHAIQQSFALGQLTRNPYGMRAILLELGEVYAEQGALRQAAESYQRVLAETKDDLLDRCKALLGLSRLSYEWNRLDTALQEAQEALDLSRHLADEELQMRASLVLARVSYARGLTTQALQQIAEIVRMQTHSVFSRESLFWQARLHIASGNLAAVQHWMEQRAADDPALPFFLHVRENLLIARWLLAHREAKEALQLLEQCLEQARHHAHTSSMLETRVLMALAYYSQNNINAARQVLQEILAHTCLESHQRLFLDEGLTMMMCLQAVVINVRMDSDEKMYVQALLTAFKGNQPVQSSAPSPAPLVLIEALSSQEQRVLRLFVAGFSKPEIAQELVISVNTVKTHLQHIYQKLNVSSRAEARAVAQRLHLL